MKRVKGLYLDYTTGVGDIDLAPEFKGQSPEFRALALSYWVAKLLDIRDLAMDEVTPESRRTIRANTNTLTVEEIVRKRESIFFISDRKNVTHKRLLITGNIFSVGTSACPNTEWKGYRLYESVGYSTFRRICEVPRPGANHGKTVRRDCIRMHSRWVELQVLIQRTGGGRFGDDREYRHFAMNPADYFLSKEIGGAA